MLPKISVITVCYNAEKFLEDAIRSVLRQSYSNKEYIVVDGGSTDGTLNIIEKYKEQLDVFISEPDKGISDAFNKGIRYATGDIIGICNADDMLVDDALSMIAKEYEPCVDVFRFQEYIWNSNTGEKKLVSPTPIRRIPIQSHLLHMGCWISKDAYLRYGLYDIRFKCCMDYELMRRFTTMGAKQKYCNYPIGYFRLGGISQSNHELSNKEKWLICGMHGGGMIGATIWISYETMKRSIKQFIYNIKW